MRHIYDFGREHVHWFPSHMRVAVEAMRRLRPRTDMVLEIPHSSANPLVPRLFPGVPRIVVYNKTDLAAPGATAELRLRCERASALRGAACTYRLLSENVDSRAPDGYRALYTAVRGAASALLSRGDALDARAAPRPVRMLVVGVPNVGKSTVINRLRILGGQAPPAGSSRKAVATGALAGVTRAVSNLVRIATLPCAAGAPAAAQEHVVYVHDTPGVLVPRIRAPEQGLLLAATGALMDACVEGHLLVDFVHHAIERGGAPHAGGDRPPACDLSTPEDAARGTDPFAARYGIAPDCPDVVALLDAVARSIGAVDRRTGVPNRAVAIAHVLKTFRTGGLGRYTLEAIGDCLEDGLAADCSAAMRPMRRRPR